MISPQQFFSQKGIVSTWNWNDLYAQEHLYNFTSAKIMRADFLRVIRDALAENAAGTMTMDELKTFITQRLKNAGLWGKVWQKNPRTGKYSFVSIGSPWRVDTIVRTNLQSAYMAQRWQAFQQLKQFRPYVQYVAVKDSRTRKTHMAMDGLVFSIDDKILNKIWPPNGFNCRCRMRALTKAQAERKGIAKNVKLDNFPDNGFDYNVGKVRIKNMQAVESRIKQLPEKIADGIVGEIVSSSAVSEYLIAQYNNPSESILFAGYAPKKLDRKTVVISSGMTKRLSERQLLNLPEKLFKTNDVYKVNDGYLIAVKLGVFKKYLVKVKDNNGVLRIVDVIQFSNTEIITAEKL